ncbi:MAG: DNA-binding response regulator [Cyanobacteria bacterium J055]|nr:MAG: DNA-binding response regulator [Cyanobacteria bacterium J055]
MKRILIVDDDKTFRMTLTRYLDKEGYSVKAVNSGTEALTAFESEPPDLVVSDIMMPEMDGFEFCRRLRATSSGQLVPFIFLSSLGELDSRIEGYTIGADDYLIKPFEPRELVAKIESQLERSRRISSEILRLLGRVTSPDNIPITSPFIPLKAEPVFASSRQPSEEQDETPETSLDALPLTPAEVRVFWEVIQGFTNKQIANRLFVSPRTVQTHLSHILTKLNLENRAQLIRFAFEKGYQPPAEE